MGIYSVPSQNAIQKQLDSTLAAGATTLTLNEDVSSLFSGVSATNPGVAVIDRIDSNGNVKTDGSREYVTFTGVSTTNLTGLTRNADGSSSDQEHAVGAIVEMVPDILWAQSIKDTMDSEHNADGTHKETALDSIITGTEATGDIIYHDGSVWNRLAKGTAEQKLAMNSGATAPEWVDDFTSITFIIDGGGSTITTGIKGDLEIPFACTISAVTMLADQSGSIVVDIWKDTYANYPPTNVDSITASAVPTISTATKSQDTTLTGWTTSISAGDTLRFNVDSVTTIKRVTLSLKVTKI